MTPLSLGIETLGGVSTKLIERNTTIPTRKAEIFSTAADNQPGVEVHVLLGERPLARDNKTIGRFQLTDIPPAPRGLPQIEVSFDIDANGILHVGAKDLGTGKEQKITITASSGLSKDEFARTQRDAESHAEEDKRQRELIEARNEADSAVYRSKKLVRENADKIAEDNRHRLEEAVNTVKDALKGEDTGAIKSANERLNESMQSVSTELYRSASERAQAQPSEPRTAGQARPGATPGADRKQEEVIDAEVVDDPKKNAA